MSQIPLLKDYKAKSSPETRVQLVKDTLKVGSKTIDPNFSRNKLQCFHTNGPLVKVDKENFSIASDSPDGKNIFTAFACEISDRESASVNYSSLYQSPDFTSATHRVYCYAFESGSEDKEPFGYDDDGEFTASHKMFQSIRQKCITNYFVCVTRHFGGKIGKLRFKYYEELAKKALSRFFPELS